MKVTQLGSVDSLSRTLSSYYTVSQAKQQMPRNQSRERTPRSFVASSLKVDGLKFFRDMNVRELLKQILEHLPFTESTELIF